MLPLVVLHWTEAEAIGFCLLDKRPRGAMTYGSSLMACVWDARQATGRYHTSGDIRPGKELQAESRLGALAYLIMLEQVGECFQRSTGPGDSSKRWVARALRAFTDLPDPEIDALYALRCCFAHNYGLVNRHKTTSLRHHFYLDRIEEDHVVQLPPRYWSGRIERISRYTRTVVDVRGLGDLAEGVLAQLRQLNARQELEIALPGKVPELLARFAHTQYRS